MSDATDLSSMRIQPSPEATTAGALFAFAEKLALSDELGSTNMATEISKPADTSRNSRSGFGRLNIPHLKMALTPRSVSWQGTFSNLSKRGNWSKKRVRSRQMVDTLIKLSADLIP